MDAQLDALRKAISDLVDLEFSQAPWEPSQELIAAGAEESNEALQKRVAAELEDRGTFRFAMQWEYEPQAFEPTLDASVNNLAHGLFEVIRDMHRTKHLAYNVPQAESQP